MVMAASKILYTFNGLATICYVLFYLVSGIYDYHLDVWYIMYFHSLLVLYNMEANNLIIVEISLLEVSCDVIKYLCRPLARLPSILPALTFK